MSPWHMDSLRLCGWRYNRHRRSRHIDDGRLDRNLGRRHRHCNGPFLNYRSRNDRHNRLSLIEAIIQSDASLLDILVCDVDFASGQKTGCKSTGFELCAVCIYFPSSERESKHRTLTAAAVALETRRCGWNDGCISRCRTPRHVCHRC